MANDDPRGMRAFAKNAAKKLSKGRFTASQTGAAQNASDAYRLAQNKAIMDSAAAGTLDFENKSIQKSPRPTRTKK